MVTTPVNADWAAVAIGCAATSTAIRARCLRSRMDGLLIPEVIGTPPGNRRELRFQARVKGIPNPVAEEVEAEHGEKDGQAGKSSQPRRLLEIATAHGEHDPPRRRGGLRAETEERQRGFREDGERD